MTKRFSERIGAREPPPIQMDEMSEELRNRLWNEIAFKNSRLTCEGWHHLGSLVASELGWQTDGVPQGLSRLGPGAAARRWLKDKFYGADWATAYDVLEIIVGTFRGEVLDRVCAAFNGELQRGRSGYRFINGVLTPITNETEMAEVGEAQEHAEEVGWAGVQGHLRQAVQMLGQRPEPDYRNAIKEAVSAVESACRHITGDKSVTLGAALKVLDQYVPIHGAMKEAFRRLYGYASDEPGVRHGMPADPNVGFDEAKFMVVACSAFVNYLASKASG